MLGLCSLHVEHLIHGAVESSDILILLKIKPEWIDYMLIDYKVISSNFRLYCCKKAKQSCAMVCKTINCYLILNTSCEVWRQFQIWNHYWTIPLSHEDCNNGNLETAGNYFNQDSCRYKMPNAYLYFDYSISNTSIELQSQRKEYDFYVYTKVK